MIRFFVTDQELQRDSILLQGENGAHAKVLRLKVGDAVVVSNGTGQECQCVVSSQEQDGYALSVVSRGCSASEATIQVRIYMAFPKADKLEHVIQKATELGAAEIIAFPSARCISRPDEKSLKKKLERWQKIAASAAEQSGRGVIPTVRTLPDLSAVLQEMSAMDLPILFYENEDGYRLTDAVRDHAGFQTVGFLTGPEGGLEPWEVQRARDAGLRICSLGKRILRCETAPLCAISAIMFAAGEF